jgi:hypothetical protein
MNSLETNMATQTISVFAFFQLIPSVCPSTSYLRNQELGIRTKSRERLSPKSHRRTCGKDRSGSEGMADVSPPVPKAIRRRGTWEFQMILDEPIPTLWDHPVSGHTPERRDAPRVTVPIASNDDHPLAGLSPQRRAQERIDAIASILAGLAIKTISKGDEVTT